MLTSWSVDIEGVSCLSEESADRVRNGANLHCNVLKYEQVSSSYATASSWQHMTVRISRTEADFHMSAACDGCVAGCQRALDTPDT